GSRLTSTPALLTGSHTGPHTGPHTGSAPTVVRPDRSPRNPMPLDLPYRATILTALGWFKAMNFRFDVTGQHHVPRRGGAVLAINHISYVDFIMAGYGALPSRR